MRSVPGRGSRSAVVAASHHTRGAIVPRRLESRRGLSLNAIEQQSVNMKSVNELLELFMRQAQLERAMKQPGGARVIEERELHAVRQELSALPEAMKHDVMSVRQ